MSKKARDLLPPDAPAPRRAEDVRPSDDPLETEVEDRKIGIRRVTALDFADRLTARNRWRPAGNSRRFWRQIEADDPFKTKPARPTDAPLDVYPAQRIDRVEGSMPKPQPDIARAIGPGRSQDEAPPPVRPLREQPRSQPTAPAPVHTPEPRTAVAPTSVRLPEPEPEPERPTQPVPVPRRLPPKPPPDAGSTRTGRQRMPSRGGDGGGTQKTAAEIREEKLAARAKLKEGDQHPLKKKSLDAYRETMQNLLFSQARFEAGEDVPELLDVAPPSETHAVKIKGEVKRRSKDEPAAARAPEPAPPRPAPPRPAPARPAPAPEPAPIDRTPPKPGAAATPAATPAGPPASAGNLNDLFGGGGDRPRIGRRGVPKTPTEGEE